MKIQLLCTFLCIIFSIPLLSQTAECNYILQGRVTDEHDSSPLSFSTVAVLESGMGSISDENGYYRLENMCRTNYHIVVRHVGCESDTIEVFMKDSIQQQNFQLEHHAEELQAVEVMANKTGGNNSVDSLSMQESRGLLIADMMQNISGVSVLKTGPNVSKPIVNGLSGNRLQIVGNQVSLQSQQWGDEHSPELDPFTSRDFDLLRGASALKYSGIGGAIVSSERPLPTKAGLSGKVYFVAADNMGLGNLAAMLEGRFSKLPKFSWRLQGSLKKSGNVKSPDYYLKNTGMEEYNFSYDLNYEMPKTEIRFFYSQFNSNLGIFSAAHIENLSDLQVAIHREQPREEDSEGFSYEIRRPYQHVEHELLGIKSTFSIDAINKLNFTLSRQFNLREEYDKHLPRNTDPTEAKLPEFALNLTSYSLDANWTKLNIKSSMELGAQLLNKQNTLTGIRDFIPEYSSNSLAVYGIKKWYFEKLELESAIRLGLMEMNVFKDYSGELTKKLHSYQYFSVASGGEYTFNNSTALSFHAIVAQRPPEINELYSEGLHHGTASMEFGNKELEKESMLELNTLIKHDKKSWSTGIFAFNKFFKDFIYLQPAGMILSIQGAFPQYIWQQDDAHLWGVDINNAYSFRNVLKLHLNAHYLNAKKLDGKAPLPFMPPLTIDAKIQHQLSFIKKSNYVALSAERVFQQDKVPDAEILQAPPAYTLFHFQAGITFKLNKKDLNVGLNIQNLGNTKYRNYLDRMRYFTDAQGRTVWLKLDYSF